MYMYIVPAAILYLSHIYIYTLRFCISTNFVNYHTVHVYDPQVSHHVYALPPAGKRCLVYDCSFNPKSYQKGQKVTIATLVTIVTRINVVIFLPHEPFDCHVTVT